LNLTWPAGTPSTATSTVPTTSPGGWSSRTPRTARTRAGHSRPPSQPLRARDTSHSMYREPPSSASPSLNQRRLGRPRRVSSSMNVVIRRNQIDLVQPSDIGFERIAEMLDATAKLRGPTQPPAAAVVHGHAQAGEQRGHQERSHARLGGLERQGGRGGSHQGSKSWRQLERKSGPSASWRRPSGPQRGARRAWLKLTQPSSGSSRWYGLAPGVPLAGVCRRV
jgi:hypothetical protein